MNGCEMDSNHCVPASLFKTPTVLHEYWSFIWEPNVTMHHKHRDPCISVSCCHGNTSVLRKGTDSALPEVCTSRKWKIFYSNLTSVPLILFSHNTTKDWNTTKDRNTTKNWNTTKNRNTTRDQNTTKDRNMTKVRNTTKNQNTTKDRNINKNLNSGTIKRFFTF